MHPTLNLSLFDLLPPHMEDELRPAWFLKDSLLAFPDDSLHFLRFDVFIQFPFLNSRFVLSCPCVKSACLDITCTRRHYTLCKELELDLDMVLKVFQRHPTGIQLRESLSAWLPIAITKCTGFWFPGLGRRLDQVCQTAGGVWPVKVHEVVHCRSRNKW
jgi:hypothetical protein